MPGPSVRLVARLDVKNNTIVKGLRYEGLRKLGKPGDMARAYYDQGADEVVYIDVVASLYDRPKLGDIIEATIAQGVFVPLTVGGGIRSVDDVRYALRCGADKVAINTQAIKTPELITEAARTFGKQCIVGSIHAKAGAPDAVARWEAYYDSGRERSYKDAIEWAKELVQLGCGELLVSCINTDGVKKGFDLDLCKAVSDAVDVPVIFASGCGSADDVVPLARDYANCAVAVASALHYKLTTIGAIKDAISAVEGVRVRRAPTLDPSIQGSCAGKRVLMIDYGVGNLRSVAAALEVVGAQVTIKETAESFEDVDCVVFPGVGAFHDGMAGVSERKMDGALKKFCQDGGHLLGICLGAQLLFATGEEFGEKEGLGIVDGSVKQLKVAQGVPVPRIGWGALRMDVPGGPDPIFDGLESGAEVYFNHSFYFAPADRAVAVAESTYGGFDYCSAYRVKNAYGVQFHPEKSGPVGIMLLRNFVASSGA